MERKVKYEREKKKGINQSMHRNAFYNQQMSYWVESYPNHFHYAHVAHMTRLPLKWNKTKSSFGWTEAGIRADQSPDP